MSVFDLDDESTWPAELIEWADAWAGRKRGVTATRDLGIYEDERVIELLDGRLVRAYHCTRLLDHERDMFFEQGLRPLSRELVVERIRRAHEVGAITDAERELLDGGHQFASQEREASRPDTVDQVCVLPSQRVFQNEPYLVTSLLATWGGEAIYNFLEANHEEETAKIRAMGRPSIVVANLDLAQPAIRDDHFITTQLGCSIVGRRLGLASGGGEIFYRGPVPAANIAAIWHPGDREYDQHKKLPR